MHRLTAVFSKIFKRTRQSGGAPAFDFTNSPSRPDAHELYSHAREVGPVCFDEGSGEWLVLGYESVLWAFKNPDKLSSKYNNEFDPLVVGNDPPEHSRYRKILARSMSDCDSQVVESYTSEWMAGFIRRVQESSGLFDAVSDLACPLPEAFSGFMLGLDEVETQQLISMRPSNRTQLNQSWPQITNYFERIVGSGRESKRDGVLGALNSFSGSEALSDREIVGLLRLLWFAGTSTSTHFLPSLLLLMLRHPAAIGKIRSDRRLLTPFVNEALRMEGPTGILPRQAVKDLDFEGVKIPANSMVKICILAANSDPSVFPAPRQIHFNRPTASVAFGHGIHFCLGGMIAKTMASKVAEVLIERIPGLQAAQDLESIIYEPSDSFRSIRSLRIQLAE